MEAAAEWAGHAEGWLRRDLELLTKDEGWRALRVAAPVSLWSRAMPDDPNDLFRWRLPAVDAPAEAVFRCFVLDILEHHKVWTKEFVGGSVVDEPAPGVRILHQRFEPGIPGVTPRDLCAIEVARDLEPGVKLVSYRSVDRLSAVPGFVRIDWWGAALIRTVSDGTRSELTYLDRENQGGWFPTWLMNRMMPGYLVFQATQVQAFFARRAGGVDAAG